MSKKFGPLPAGAAAQHVIVLGKTRSGKSSKMRLLAESCLEQGHPVGIIDPKGDWWGIKSSADGKRPGYPVVIFGGKHADIKIDEHSGGAVAELVAADNRPFLIDLGGWMPSPRTKFFVDFASKFFTLAAGHRFLFIDEVHNFAPQGKVLDPQAGKALHWANRLASEGAGKGIILVSASQRPQKVHKDYVTSHETLIACRVIHPLDRNAVKEWVDGCGDPEQGKEVIKTLASLQRPEAWVWSPEIDFGPKRVTFPMFNTYDSFKPQDVANKTLSGWAAVDLEAVQGQLAAVAAQEKAKDPTHLQREIDRLTNALAVAQDVMPSAPVIDQDALSNAELAGYNRGADDALNTAFDYFQAALATLGPKRKAFVDAEMAISNDLDALAAATVEDIGRALKRPAASTKPINWQHGPTPLTTRQSHAALQRIVNGTGPGEKMKKAERSILTALAQYPQGRTKVQTAILTGYAVTGGGFNNALGALRTRAYIDGSGDFLRITPQGLQALGSYQPLPHGDALLQHWLGQLKKAEREVLAAVVKVYPRHISKEALAAHAGYEPTGGGFNNALGKLRTLELITRGSEIRASEALFG